MSRFLGIGLLAGALVMALGLASGASAANPDFCHDYAQAAVRQTRAAYDSHHCGYAIEQNRARWSSDYRTHFDWCLSARHKDAVRERDARRDTLDHCVRGEGWRHDDDHHHW